MFIALILLLSQPSVYSLIPNSSSHKCLSNKASVLGPGWTRYKVAVLG